MRSIFFVITSLLLQPFAQANDAEHHAPNPSIKAKLASKSLLLDIEQINNTSLIAVGEYGHIINSSDGKNWQQANVPVQSTLTSVFFLDESLGWAVGHDATILHTQDGGKNWQIQYYQPDMEKPLFDVVFKNAQEGVVVGAYGLMLRTLDGGVTWQSEFHQEFLLADDIDYLNELKADDEEAYLDEIAFILPHFNRLVADGRTMFLLGETGLLAKSNDFGKTWQQYNEIYQGSFFDLGRTKTGNLLVAGLRGHIFRGTNNGTQWSEVNTNTTALLNDVVVTDENRIFVLGNSGMLLESVDDGKSYQVLAQKDGKSLVAGVWFKKQLVVASEVGIKVISFTE
ncbi:WD40/YVTN/BNR-like repeat-containing protein [Litorilituus sediminis]|uniref:Photosynthesis system II assembly factor Ycf48/Hcf136-like domain-containing protein n=1 Tax=Litorilituus sediminis TaxID=718192 RepID=A0A4P6P5S3_9GAMM|nr:YCF48-related protein [Litorilituus sediminis]QBG34695.1 hypothetical protein EMK97_02520 [Litorilituus sediminis]